MYLKYDNMHINGIINTFICINNHVNSCTNCMLSVLAMWHMIIVQVSRTWHPHERLSTQARERVCVLCSMPVKHEEGMFYLYLKKDNSSHVRLKIRGKWEWAHGVFVHFN